MRKLLLLVLVVLFATPIVFSQTIEVSEVTADLNETRANALETTIFKTDAKTVEKEWESLMKDFDAKVKSKKEIFADNATIKSISENTLDVYATVAEGKNGEVKLTVGFDLGGAYLSSSVHSEQYKSAEKIVKEFALNITLKAFEEFISDQEKELDKMIKSRDKTIDDKERLEKEIVDYTERIEKNTKEIEDRVKEVEEQNKVIEEKTKEVEQIKKDAKNVK